MNLWLKFVTPVTAHFRRKRFAKLLSLEPDFLSKKVLDVGASIHFWEKVGVDLNVHDITLLNIASDSQSCDSSGETLGAKIVLYDGVKIPFPDAYFDWVICNSVIEHVPTNKRANFCSEIRRVGRQFVVQTPAFAFPVEPHFVTLFPHWLPRRLGRQVARFGLWYLLGERNEARLREYFDEVNLLKRRELQTYFPDAKIETERFIGLPKSYSAIQRKA
jgi:hypothetical protein